MHSFLTVRTPPQDSRKKLRRTGGKENNGSPETGDNVDTELGDLRDNLQNVLQYFNVVKELENIKSEVQQLEFTEKFPLKDYRLIEVPKKLADEFVEGQKLMFRGDPEDFVVLSSDNRSYSVKEVETSNSLFLMPQLKFGDEVAAGEEPFLTKQMVNGITHHYLEIKEVECVSIVRLREMLRENELVWNWQNSTSSGKTYSLADLQSTIQMSNGELNTKLNSMPVIEHEDCYRWLSYDYIDNFIGKIIDRCDDNVYTSVNPEKIDFESLREALPTMATDAAIRWFLRAYCEPLESGNGFRMIPRLMSRSRASFLLRNVTKLDVEPFETQINQLLPSGMEFSFDHIKGLCTFEENMRGRFISYLNVEDLPEDPRERLKLLFGRKESWTMDEVTPYLTDICANAKSMSGLMVSHCRSSKNDKGEKIQEKLLYVMVLLVAKDSRHYDASNFPVSFDSKYFL